MNHKIDYQKLSGQSHVFPDGVVIRIVQVKNRNDGLSVIYETDYGNALPRRFVVTIDEFVHDFGHLFNIEVKKNG